MGILHASHGCEMLKGCYSCFHSLQSILGKPLGFSLLRVNNNPIILIVVIGNEEIA